MGNENHGGRARAPICSNHVSGRSGDSELEDLPYPPTIFADCRRSGEDANREAVGCAQLPAAAEGGVYTAAIAENLASGENRIQLVRRADIRRSRRQGL